MQMTYEHLLSLIEGQSENQSLDFKADSPLHLQSLAKDLIAMSNVRDGGIIVFGVSEHETGFKATGVSSQNIASFNKDKMKDKLWKYTDPPVDFDIFFPTNEKETYVVIKVHPFKEIPVLCIRDWDKALIANTIYYRNTTQRVQSAAVSNAHDLRAIIENAARKMFNKYRDLGLTLDPVTDNNEKLIMPDNEIVKKIKSKGFFEYKFSFSEGISLDLAELLPIIRNCQVNYNWAYPYIHSDLVYGDNFMQFGDNFLEMGLDFGSRKEYWRFYTDGSFSLISAFIEDWFGDSGEIFRKGWASKFPPEQYLFYRTSILEPITAFISFIDRLIEFKHITGNLKLDIVFQKTDGRQLHLDSSNRVFTIETKKTSAKQITETHSFNTQDFRLNSSDIANKIVLNILKRFNFNPQPESVAEEQMNIMNRR